MTYKDYIKNKKKEPIYFRDEIRKALGNMPLSTYYKKLNQSSFSDSEKKLIADHLGKPMGELFPGTISWFW